MKRAIVYLIAAAMLAGCATRQPGDNSEDSTARKVLVAITGIAIGIALARKGGGGAGYVPQSGVTDYDWAWDLFYNEHRQLVWACRGMQTSQFAELQRCDFKAKNDYQWPALEAPR